MPLGLNGPGNGLPLPQFTYPSQVFGSEVDLGTTVLGLNPGEAIPIPAGEWLIEAGLYCVVQYLDPVTQTWLVHPTAGINDGVRFVSSDGFNFRIANMTGCVVDAEVTAPGNGYTGATPTLALAGVGSGTTILPIIGGALSIATIGGPGKGYGLPPILIIPAPPFPGKPASAYAVLANGTVAGVSFISQGAGYVTPPTITVATNPADPNFSSISTIATILTSIILQGRMTGAIVTNPGAPLTSIQITNGFSITVSGGSPSTTATVVATCMFTALSGSVTALGGGYGVNNAAPFLTTFGGVPVTSASLADPAQKLLAWRPRQAQIQLNVASSQVSVLGNIYDGGLFLGNSTTLPNPVVVGGAPTTAASVVLTFGGAPDFVVIQPTP